ncbi:MAG: hypothetical protein JNK15_03045 [Planctomycetes bacterium]|nr:hypothetical protein [Planctomycetota bacterium]
MLNKDVDRDLRARAVELTNALQNVARGDSRKLPPWLATRTLESVRAELEQIRHVFELVESLRPPAPLFVEKC